MEFHVSRAVRKKYNVDDLLFNYSGNVVFGNIAASRQLAKQINDAQIATGVAKPTLHAGSLFAMGLIDELSHAMVARYRKTLDPAVLPEALRWFEADGNKTKVENLLLSFTGQFPNVEVYREKKSAAQWLQETTEAMPNREAALEELLLLWLANINPAFAPFKELFDDTDLNRQTIYKNVTSDFKGYFATRPRLGAEAKTLLDALMAPMLASPDSLGGQLAYIRDNWVEYLGDDLRQILLAIDILKEEDIALWMLFHPPSDALHHARQNQGWGSEGFLGDEFVGFGDDGRGKGLQEYEAFSQDQAWMPTVVLIAKSTYVWLEQLSKKYQRHIHRLDQIPDEELALLASRGLNGLWLIGLWERSEASQTIKRLRGQADAVASAYSLKDYRIAEDLGGTGAYENLRDRAANFGIRLASDMVPNHMGIDSTWVMEHPDWFLSRHDSPFPVYQFEGPDLSTNSRAEIKIEDHYYEQTDAAVVFRLRERSSGRTDYIYHGNDGTTFAWNDTAQLDYSKAYVREQVIQTILNVAKLFPIIRFDAAMTLAKKHVQRLWFPLPGAGGSIPSRAESAMTQAQFDALMPHEFWREVVDRVAAEVPGTLLLAEAFWLLEGYFVRTLGMHRVYNSAFMNMLRDEENAKYRSYLKKTIEFDPDILKRYVNFMSNPDERTAIDQFGTGDKYFGTCALLATLPGLPMFGHGQIEAFTEKYGMEYKRARYDEYPNDDLVARHQREIAPLLKSRHMFAESGNFVLYDFWTGGGAVDENVFAYSNRSHDDRALVLFNNSYGSTRGTIHVSSESMDKATGWLRQRSLTEALQLPSDGSVILAYKDTISNLEYLRRSHVFDHHGFTISLRGYQYVVLRYWRQMRSSWEEPWDELCDSLNGAGVHNLGEAMFKLRLRPLHEALETTLGSRMIQAVIEAAGEQQAARQKSAPLTAAARKHEATHSVAREIASRETASKEIAYRVNPDLKPSAATGAGPQASAKPPEVPVSPLENLDPRLVNFTLAATHFFREVLKISSQMGLSILPPSPAPANSTDSAKSFQERCASTTLAAARLPILELEISPRWPTAARAILPSGDPGKRANTVWVPVLAWVALSHISEDAARTLAAFDHLRLQQALGEIFSSLGLEGEDAWRAVSRVRVLLANATDAAVDRTKSQAFWNEPEVRWLAGISEAHGITYLNKERFEELVCWLQLPALIRIARLKPSVSGAASKEALAEIQAQVATALAAAAQAGYDLEKYLKLLASKDVPPLPTEAPSQSSPDPKPAGQKASKKAD